MKRINWDRFAKLEYSARRASLHHPDSQLGKEMLFLVETVQLLRQQNHSLRERLKQPTKTEPAQQVEPECFGSSYADVNGL